MQACADSTQLPIAAYFDEALYQAEQAQIFAAGPHYLGHELMVSEEGDFHVLDQVCGGFAVPDTDKDRGRKAVT